MAFAMDCRPTFATKDWVNRALRFLIFFIIITNLLGWTLLTFLKVTRDENERKKKKNTGGKLHASGREQELPSPAEGRGLSTAQPPCSGLVIKPYPSLKWVLTVALCNQAVYQRTAYIKAAAVRRLEV